MSGLQTPPAPGNGAKVEFARIFGSSNRERLKQGRACVTGISAGQKGWQAQVAEPVWHGHKVGFFRKLLSRLLPAGRREMSQKLHGAYVDGFRQLASRSSEQHLPSSKPLPGLSGGTVEFSSSLASPLGFTVASAMELAGLCRLDHGRSGHVGLKKHHHLVDEAAIKRLDYLVNLNPQRLAFEFLAAGRTLPNGYLERVLIPHFCSRLEQDANYSHEDALREVNLLQNRHHLHQDRDIDLERMMEMRRRVDGLVGRYSRKVGRTKPWSWMPAASATETRKASGKEKGKTGLSGKVREVSVQALVDQGRASRQVVRDYFIQELRRQGVGRVAARERVVALLNTHNITPGTFLPVSRFIGLAEELKLFPNVRTGQVVQDYLRLVDQIDRTAPVASGEKTASLLEKSGVKAGQGVVIGVDGKREMMVIERPLLDVPQAASGYQCNEDEIWLITQRVERSWVFRWTKDMVKAVQSKVARNKRGIAVELVARLSTAVVTGVSTGGIGGAMYLLASAASLPVIFGVEQVIGHLLGRFHGYRIKRFDDKGRPDTKSARNTLYDSIAYVTAEQTLTDSLNAFSNLQDDLKGLKQLQGRANLSAKEQIRYRRFQVMQQLRSSQLGEKFSNLDRFMVEAVSDISRFEDDFEKKFPQLWALLETEGEDALTPLERVELFNKAANQLKSDGLVQIAKEKRHEWLSDLVQGEGSRRASDKALLDVVRDIKPLSKKEQRVNAVACNTNWLARKTIDTAIYGSKLVGHFIFTNLVEGGLKSMKAGVRWFLLGVLPRKFDYLPIPTASLCVYWVTSFLGGKMMDRFNDALNRIRSSKVIATRRDEKGDEVPFDEKVVQLKAEDWRALRRESKKGLQKLADTLKALHREHKELDKKLRTLTDTANLLMDREEMRMRAAMLILRRKHLEQQVQKLMAGVVGTFYQETVRSEWELRQALDDKADGVHR